MKEMKDENGNVCDFSGEKEQFLPFVDEEQGRWKDGEVSCKECGVNFEVTWKQARNFYKYDQSIPKRCPECREKRKARSSK
jgi:hypothetical protein